MNIKSLCLYLLVCLSSFRVKAGGNNDASGNDDSDLEKMKQVNFSSAPHIMSGSQEVYQIVNMPTLSINSAAGDSGGGAKRATKSERGNNWR